MDPAAAVPSDRASVSAITIALWACVLTQKLTLPLGIEFPFAIVWLTALYLFYQGRAHISPFRLLALAAIFFIAGTTQALVHGTRFSFEALLIGFGTYLLFIFKVPLSSDGYIKLLKNFQNIGLMAAGLVLLQWVTQVAHLGVLDLEPIIPGFLYYEGYGYMQPTGWMSSWYKPNGVFFLEASFVSQFIAIAIIIEVFFFQRLGRIALLLVALLSTLSGTGTLMLLFTAPFLLRIVNAKIGVALLVLIPIAIAGLAASGALDYFLSRTGEFGVKNTSGYGRFVEPFAVLPDIYDRGGFGAIIAGIGPGNIYDLPYLSNAFAPNPAGKLLAEYGIPVTVLWLLFIHVAVWRSNTPFVIIFPVMICYNFMNGSLLLPIIVGYVLLLVGLPCLPKRLASKSVAPRVERSAIYVIDPRGGPTEHLIQPLHLRFRR